jgi:hypothetical protein
MHSFRAARASGRHKCRSSVWPWIIEMLFSGNVWQGGVVRLGGCDPAQQLLRLPSPRSAGAQRKIWCIPCRTLQLLPAAAALTCKLQVFRKLRDAAHAEVPCGLGQSKCPSREMFEQGGVVRLEGCDPAQPLLRLLSPRSARGSAKDVVHPMPHFTASARNSSLEV